MPPVLALAAAQCWVRDVTAFELRTRFAVERGSTASRFDSHVASQQFRRFAALPGDARPYQHPVYWAAFTLTGL